MTDNQDKLRLTNEEKQKIINFLNAKAPGVSCSVCGHEEKFIADHLVTPLTTSSSGGGMHIGSPTYPMAMTICKNCFHVDFHAAVPMGVAGEEQKKTKEGGDG